MGYLIPTYNHDTKEWYHTTFDTKKEFADFIGSLIKDPGEIGFNDIIDQFQLQGKIFLDKGYYCNHVELSKDYKTYWNTEKEKCTKGVIYIYGEDTWYLPREYYMWINFLPIYHKDKRKFDLPLIWDTQYFISLVEYHAELTDKHVVMTKKRQLGQEQPHSSLIQTPNGPVTMGDISIGDELWNPDGTIQTVVDKFPQGEKDVYEVEFMTGDKVKCGLNHLWAVYDSRSRKNIVISLKDLMTNNLIKGEVHSKGKIYNNYRFGVNFTNPIPYSKKDLKIPPYVLGCLLGDGCIKNNPYICGIDHQIFDEVEKELGEEYYLGDYIDSRRSIHSKPVSKEERNTYFNGKYGLNKFVRNLEYYGLFKRHEEKKGIKFIPDDYLYSSIQDRIDLLQGLMDTDGFINNKGLDIHFTNINKTLIDQANILCKSLGLKTTIVKKPKHKATHQDYYRLRISGHIPFPIFRLKRKLDRQYVRSTKVYERNPIISIKKLDYKEEQSCILVSNPNHLYLTDNYVVTHNSFQHAAKLINSLWFDEGVTLKLIGYFEKYINTDGTWSFINEYRDFLNTNTGWYRNFEPDKTLNWQQRVKVNRDGRETYKGLKGRLLGITTKSNPTGAVGGSSRYCIYEESGIAPSMDTTYEYIRPALSLGEIITGQFIAYGSVGELDQCEPLKKYMKDPGPNGFYAIKTKFYDDKGTEELAGLFIPEQWSRPPYIDQYGNSLVQEALESVKRDYRIWQKDLNPEEYQLRVSQHPWNLMQAFHTRKESVFPKHLIQAQKYRIENGEYPFEKIQLKRDIKTGEIKPHPSDREPIWDFPIKKAMKDKRGCLLVYERPEPNPKFGMYYASVDPVNEGKTTESNSLCSIVVWKNEIEVSKMNEEGEYITYIEEGKVVAEWAGRFDDINDTHEELRIIIEWYNAWTIVEANVLPFITHMTNKKKLHYLVTSDQMIFNREISGKAKPNYPYGWKNIGRFFYDTILPYFHQFINEELGTRINPDTGNEVPIMGIERIPSLMIMKEMEDYHPGLNVDRIVSMAALTAFVAIQKANRERLRKTIDHNINLDKSNKKVIFNRGTSAFSGNFKQSPFNLRKTSFRSIR